MNRRRFLQSLAQASLLAGAPALRAAGNDRAPFRLLYSNDATNILSCTSPWHARAQPFRPAMLEATVDEVAGIGVDAHLLQPGLGWVPLWPSRIYPVEEHYRWLKDTFGVGPDSFGKFALGGGDLVRLFVDRCRARGQAPFVSFRLNDIHHKDQLHTPPGAKLSGSVAMSFTRFYIEHPEWRIGPTAKQLQLGMNWAIPEVRAHKLGLITELCEGYDLAGLELDFMRFYSLFPLDRTTREERAAIVTGFIREVRAVLDRTVCEGRRRWLCARIPCWLKGHDALGIDLPAMRAAGLDMVNVSTSYYTQQHTELAAICKQVPGVAVYAEMCHATWTGPKLGPGGDSANFRRTTAEQYQTTAHAAYAAGATGVSLFNFAYYREHGGPGRGPFSEPPFAALRHLADPAWLARQPQHWFLAPGWNNPFIRPAFLPRAVTAGTPTRFPFRLTAPTGGWPRDARLRIQAETDLGASRWRASWNDRELAATDDVTEPFATPYPPMLGQPAQMRAWTVPVAALREGANILQLTLEAGDDARVAFLDLAAT